MNMNATCMKTQTRYHEHLSPPRTYRRFMEQIIVCNPLTTVTLYILVCGLMTKRLHDVDYSDALHIPRLVLFTCAQLMETLVFL